MIIRAVDHEADLGLDRAAVIDAQAAGGGAVLLADGLEQARQRSLSERPVDHDAERPTGAMTHQQDDGVIEARIAQCGRSDQELAGERSRFRCSGGILQRRMPERRRQQNRGESQKRTLEPGQGHDLTVDRSGGHHWAEAGKRSRKSDLREMPRPPNAVVPAEAPWLARAQENAAYRQESTTFHSLAPAGERVG